MRNPITSEIVVAYTRCPRKAYLLHCTEEHGTPHAYDGVLADYQRANQQAYVAGIQRAHPEARPYAGERSAAGRHVLLDATLRTADLEAWCPVLTPAASGAAGHGRAYEPTLVVGTHTIGQDQRLALQFAGSVLGQVQGTPPVAGTIVGMDGQAHRVPLAGRDGLLARSIEAVRAWTAAPPSGPPPVIVNAHCPQCQFRAACLADAERDDDLSLLDRVTPKVRQRYHDRGIFTVRQLSYSYRPRKQRKPTALAPIRHQPELQALAIRTGKTYLQDVPTLSRAPVECVLDIEGVPDRRAYYLFGLLVCRDGAAVYQASWAESDAQEGQAWRQLLDALAAYPEAPVYHYGQYERRALAILARRYQTDCAGLEQRLVNLNAAIYGKVYFPVRSNRLKDIGHFLGMSWSAAEASGLQSLVWRDRWVASGREEDKQQLLTYNEEDCRALVALAEALSRLRDTAATEPAVDFAAQPKQEATVAGETIHHQFGAILRSAHAGYAHAKISLGQARAIPAAQKQRGAQPGHPGHGRIVPRAGKVVSLASRRACPHCDDFPLQPTERLADKTIIDLVFTNSGCRKTVTKYVGAYGACRQCGRQYPPPDIGAFGSRIFGHGLQAWVIYQRLVLRLPYRIITQVLGEQFGEHISEGSVGNFLRGFARAYAETGARCHQQLLASPFVHVDETKISIQGVDQYVWVFTDGAHVLFRLTATRETAVVRDVLAGYTGILVTDFYAGYDAINCRQQKCLVHLIRDLNEDLWRAPFDREFETFVREVRDLMVPILEDADRYGLKRRHLGKFLPRIERFYRETITGRTYRSELVRTYQKRFQRYRQSLFTFLEYDGIPWNNNMAERGIRHLAIQRKISGSFFASVAPQYLLLLGLAQTCRFQGKSLLKFLLSRGKDIDAFQAAKRRSIPLNAGVAKKDGQEVV
jgi:predicted RecB family nuclease